MECCCPRKGKSSFRIARPPIGTRPASAAASVTSFRTLASSPISLSRKTSPLFPLWKSGTPPAPPLALMKCSSLLALIRANSPIAAPANSPAASVNASASPALSPPILPSCSWTSPSAHSIPLRAPSSSANSAPSPAASARPSSSSLTICAKLCSSPRALSCSKPAASLPAPRRRNFFALTTPRSAPSLHLSSCPREPPHEPPNDHLVFLRRSPRRNPRRHPRSPRARSHRHDHCHSHRRPARHVHCATARLARHRAGRRQHLPNHPQPRPLRLPDSHPVHRRHWQAHRHCRARPLCAAPHPAQHLRRPYRHRSRRPRIRRSHGHDSFANPLPRPFPARARRHSRRNSHRHHHHHRRRYHRRRHRRRRPRHIYLPRRRLGQRCPHSRRRHSRRTPRSPCRFPPRPPRASPEGFLTCLALASDSFASFIC